MADTIETTNTAQTIENTGNRNDAQAPPMRIARVLGLPVHALAMEQTLAWIARRIDERADANGSAATATPPAQPLHQIVTLNPEIVMAAQRDESLRAAITSADLCIADGVGVVWAARRRGQRLERVTGVDLLERTAQVAAARGWRLFLLGAAPGIAELAGEVLQRRYPGLQLAGAYSGGPQATARDDILTRLATMRPDILFVAFGSPAQERWIAGLREVLGAAGVSVAVGVGGAFDFIAGHVPRAPRWMRRVGLEWLYRLLREPWRWRRMLALPRFALAVILCRDS